MTRGITETQIRPLLLQAAFTIESLAHLQHMEYLLPQAEFLRSLFKTAGEINNELLDGMDNATAAVRLADLITEIEQ